MSGVASKARGHGSDICLNPSPRVRARLDVRCRVPALLGLRADRVGGGVDQRRIGSAE